MNNTPEAETSHPINNAFSKTTLGIAISFSVIYWAWLLLFVGVRSDHVSFYGVLLVAFFASRASRKFVLGFVFFIVFWILYDGMRVYPNYMVNPIHIAEPYNIEKMLFGFNYNGAIVTPNEYWAANTHWILDLLAGVFYLTWVPLPLSYACYLYWKDKQMMLRFSACFLFANLVGFVIYYLYPAAPPWYVATHGFEQNFNISGSAAQLLKFDELVGSPVFENMYEKNANVFAAIPSLHSAYPIVLFYFGLKKKYKIASILFFADILGIWFAAVYSLHHYIIDVLLGALCAIIAIFVFESLLMRSQFRHVLARYVNFIRG